MPIRVCLAGATGWAGSELARGIAGTTDIEIVSGVSRSHSGKTLADVLHSPALKATLYASAAEALAVPCDVFVEYTKPASAKSNILQALEHGLRRESRFKWRRTPDRRTSDSLE